MQHRDDLCPAQAPMKSAAPSASPPVFSPEFAEELQALFRWRRDVRAFRRDALPADTFTRLVRIASLAPSVGFSQPWRFVRVEDRARRAAVRASFELCNADALHGQAPEQQASYARLKLSGLDAAPLQFALFADGEPARGHGLGRRTMPQTVAYSAVLALHTLWLAARAEGIGLGWVSILDPTVVANALDVSSGWTFIGYFCMGYPLDEDSTPALERAGWEARCDLDEILLER